MIIVRVLVLDEPFRHRYDPVSSANLSLFSSNTNRHHLIARHGGMKDVLHAAVINKGQVCAAGTAEQVAAAKDFLQLVGGRHGGATVVAGRWCAVGTIMVR